MLYRFDEKRCLNGWWKFFPEYAEAQEVCPSAAECAEEGYLVPSFYNRMHNAVRFPGESYHVSVKDPEQLSREDADLLMDTYGYPGQWTKAKSAWAMRSFSAEKKPGRRYFLLFEGAGPVARVYLNGVFICEAHDMTLPFDGDITDALHDGENELCVHLVDYERSEFGKPLVPCGGLTADIRGIWQDVYLLERPEVYVKDVTIVTSVREKTLRVKAEICNSSARSFAGRLSLTTRGCGFDDDVVSTTVSVAAEAGASVFAETEIKWESPRLWDVESPNLYMLEAKLVSEEGDTVCVSHERFGFREVWIDGESLMLNGHPLHLFSDWGHRVTLLPYTRGWVQKWFGMLRDYNMNHSRLHTGPHPEFILEMADEQGILITDETALFGSGDGQGNTDDRFWQASFEHVERFVRRDKNHPCMILWSCENEMRWVSRSVDKCREYLPRIRKYMNGLDPTRPAYHEGDSSLWNEHEQDIVSRHYGKDCTGLGWWDHKQPLHSGEMGLFHYSGPNNTVQYGGDSVWEDQEKVNLCAVEDTAMIVNDARANGVCALGPWNFSCHLNLRNNEEKVFTYDDYTAPGIKPLKVRAGTAEFEYWKEGKGYIQPRGTEKIPFMFRPFAALELSMRCSYFADRPIEKTFTFVNDLPRDVEGAEAVLTLRHEGGEVKDRRTVSVRRGCRESAVFTLCPPFTAGRAVLRMEVTSGAETLDCWEKDISLDAYEGECGPAVYVWGDGSSEPALRAVKARFARVERLADVPDNAVCLIERNAVQAGSTVNKELASLCARGVRVVLLSQSCSVFPSVSMEEKPLQTAFIRSQDSPIVRGLTDGDIRFWGDDAFSLLSGDTYVVNSVYKKDALERMNVILDSGEGNFGDGDLESAVLFTVREGRGVIVACQLLITEKFDTVAAAGRLLVNMLRYAAEYTVPEEKDFVLCEGASQVEKALESAKNGASVLLWNADETVVQAVAKATGVKLAAYEEPEGTYNCVRRHGAWELEGLSNADLTGIEKVSYSEPWVTNEKIADRVLRYAEGMEPLLTTAPESCQRPFFVYGCSGELMRTIVTTRLSHFREETSYVVMGKITLGRGTVYISTFRNPNPEKIRLDRLKNVLAHNISRLETGSSLLDGECARSDRASGKGYAETPRTVPLQRCELPRMLEACTYMVERMNTKPILDMYPFEKQTAPGGRLVLPEGDTAVYCPLFSRFARKQHSLGTGLPDPMAQTFADAVLEGCTAEFYLNAELLGTLEEGKGTLSDINLERGLNHVLILVHARGKNASLCVKWHNILGSPEYGFSFD